MILLKYDWNSLSLYIGTEYATEKESGSISIPYNYKEEELIAFLKTVKWSTLRKNAIANNTEPEKIKTENNYSVHYSLPKS